MIEHPPVERFPLAIRTLTVSSTTRLGASFVRVTLTGDDLADFAAPGPADHVKAFFPDPTTGELAVPRLTAEGMARPDTGTVLARDYTPRSFRAAEDDRPAELDIDFVVHGASAPASSWAAKAAPGDTLVIAGPRGSHPAPTGMDRVVLGADATALPAVARWIEMLPEDVEICAFVELDHPSDAGYLEPELVHRASVIWLDRGDGALERGIRNVDDIDESTYFWIAGEAGGLVPIRRHLRRELGLPARQVKVDGYWRAGEAGRDHHAPLDPNEPED
ncbi:siderophore-interacting protein [Salinibacterium sp. SYSU T00001]|uniref:siderophore-interacting protein n=1 Tax=Homoserinimonas sedimenticola TaxID=2986805 RepID=UPI0022366466|nr:siderophore-interacting protein [Salinibacterium sedimenticola]MCW4384615.1 siderophore-interacting protein [Salinibacterium sedimenticola]